MTIVAYTIADNTFWTQPHATETRGITFDTATGEIVSRPFAKFFNANENAWTLEANLDFTGVRVFDKRDGSMITPVFINGRLWFKTKKSFFSDVAIAATANCYPNVEAFCLQVTMMGYTPIFEYTSPDNKIVIEYGSTPQYVLLGIRNNETGELLPRDEVVALATNVDLIEEKSITIEQVRAHLATERGIEGYIAALKDCTLIKYKTVWYLQNHRVMTELRERDVADMVISENLDDLKSTLVAQGLPLDEVESVETQVASQVAAMQSTASQLLELINLEPTAKDAALKYAKSDAFGPAKLMQRGIEPDWVGLWRKRYLKQYSLRVLYNPNF